MKGFKSLAAVLLASLFMVSSAQAEAPKNLNELLKSGVLTQEEFEKAKKKILDN